MPEGTSFVDMFNQVGPWGVLAALLWHWQSQIRPALDRNTEAFGMIAKMIDKER